MRKLESALKLFAGKNTREIENALQKSARIDIRVSKMDKTSVKNAAKACHCTVSEYLLRLHYIANEKLK